jgi:hypothetical protein
VRAWLVAGHREDGAADDFYASLEHQATTARQRYNAEHDKPLTTATFSARLLPGTDDRPAGDRGRHILGGDLAETGDLLAGPLAQGGQDGADMAADRPPAHDRGWPDSLSIKLS